MHSAGELDLVTGLVLKKAASEPHYCETYADLVFCLRERLPEFPDPEGGKPMNIKRSLLDAVQQEYMALAKELDVSDEKRKGFDLAEIEIDAMAKRSRMREMMRFVGLLFIRQLVPVTVVRELLHDQIGCTSADETPSEHCVDCAVALLEATGHTLEVTSVGKNMLAQMCGRLLELKNRGGAGISSRLKFKIQDLLEMRSAGWIKKTFRNKAKTLAVIASEQEQGLGAEGSHSVVMGARPSFVAEA